MSTSLDDHRFLGRTFDDFLFRPQKGRTETRRQIALASRLTPALSLELPIVSANMDSVTGMRMARAMALEGGLGVVHRGQTIERQAAKVARVKRSHGAVIESPLCLPLGTTLSEVRAFIRKHNITGILIEERPGSGILAGLLSGRDMPWVDGNGDTLVDELMTPFDRLHTAPPGISAEEAERLLYKRRIERLPLVDAERRIHGLITRKDILFLKQRPFASKDPKGRLLVSAAVGARGDFLDRAAALVEAGVDCLVIDIAHGHSEVMRRAVEAVRARVAAVPLICGNVATAEGALYLKELGCDAIKVGVGPGRGCRTRLETAAGVPQLQAVREAWCAVGETVPIIADGGIRDDKDVFLALVCGASTVMLGSALSGTDESPGQVIVDPATHTKKKIYRGMTSPQAVFESLYDTEDDEEVESALATPAEGQEIQVNYRGSVVDILGRVRGHLRSSVSYAGEASLADARRKVVVDPMRYLIPLSEAARRESYAR
jgi:IMP dehydrogenase